MRLTFHGGARTVTGSKFLLDTGPKRILIDCGLFQGEAKEEEHFNQLPFDPNEIDVAVMTHGHLDHVGLLPLMAKESWRGRVISTPATRDVAGFILHDSARQIERAWGRRTPEYTFTPGDVENTLNHWTGVPYGRYHDIGDGVSLRFFDAGHILGSASVEVTVKRNGTTKRVVFSGDLGRPNMPILRDPAKIPGAEVVCIESTYGDRLHDMQKNRDRLKEFVREIVATKGHLLIPAFAIGRTQTLLYELNHLIEKGEVPRVPVVVDSPLGINITGLYRRHDDCFDEHTKKQINDGDLPFDFPGLRETRGWQDSQRLASTPGPMIIIAGSGMMHGGRILGHLKSFAGRKTTMILVVGYQAHGTLGRRLLEGDTSVTIEGVPIEVKARVKAINGFSAHGDRDELIGWLDAFEKKPEATYCVHGEGKVVDAFAATLADRFAGMKTFAPGVGESVEI